VRREEGERAQEHGTVAGDQQDHTRCELDHHGQLQPSDAIRASQIPLLFEFEPL